MLRYLALMAATLLSAAILADVPPEEDIIFGFGDPETVENWIATTDSVMGGVSEAEFEVSDEGMAVFSGELSLTNNGGFALVRSKDKALEIGDAAGLMLRVKTDGKQYKLTVRLSDEADSPMHQAPFEAPEDEWAVVKIPLTALKASLRGRPVPDAPVVTPEAIRSIGLLIADGQEGPFRIECDWIGIFAPEPKQP